MTPKIRQFNFFAITRQRLLLTLSVLLLLSFSFVIGPIINVDLIGWNTGFSHPLQGWDHLLTMLAVGIWAAQLRGQAVWLLPLSFVGVMSLGGLAGTVGISIPSVEIIILLSSVVFGFLITRKVRFSTKVNVLTVAFFAFFHGYAHGQEISTSASLLSYTLGFMVATLLLHGAGILTARLVVLAFAVIFAGSAYAEPTRKIPLESAAPTAQTEHKQCVQFAFMTLKPNCPEAWVPENSKSNRWLLNSPDPGGSIDQSLRRDAYQKHFGNKVNSVNLKNHIALAQGNGPKKLIGNTLEAVDNITDFSKSHPDINNTPGISFLSNGVGVNSPPATVSHTTKALSSPPQTRIPSFEDSLLHFTRPSFNFSKHFRSKQLFALLKVRPVTNFKILSAQLLRQSTKLYLGDIACTPKNLTLTFLETYAHHNATTSLKSYNDTY